MRNQILKLLLLSNVIFVLAGSFLGPLFTVFVQHFTTDVVIISFTWALFIGSTSLFMLLLYRVGDQFNKLQLVQLGFLIRAIAWICYIFAGNIWAVLAIQILLGMGEACGTPAFSALFSEHLDKNHHVADFSEEWIAYNLVGAGAALVGGFLVHSFGFPTLFVIMSTLALTSYAISLKLSAAQVRLLILLLIAHN